MFDPIESDNMLTNRSSKESWLSSTSYIYIEEGRSSSSGKKKNYTSPLLYPNADLRSKTETNCKFFTYLCRLAIVVVEDFVHALIFLMW